MSHSAPREVTLNGQDLGYICFVCGHPTIPIDNDTRCYSYYGKNNNQFKILLFVWKTDFDLDWKHFSKSLIYIFRNNEYSVGKMCYKEMYNDLLWCWKVNMTIYLFGS